MQQQTILPDTGIQQQLYDFKTTEAGPKHQNDDDDDLISPNFGGMTTKARFQQKKKTSLHYGESTVITVK